MITSKEMVAELNRELGDSYLLGDGLEKISLNDLIDEYKVRKENGSKVAVVTITGLVSVVSKFEEQDGQQYCVFTFAENAEQRCTCAGDMPKLYNKLMNLSDNNVEVLNETLKATPMRIEIWKKKTKNGYTYTRVRVLGFVEPEASKAAESAADAAESAADAAESAAEAADEDNPFDLF